MRRCRRRTSSPTSTPTPSPSTSTTEPRSGGLVFLLGDHLGPLRPAAILQPSLADRAGRPALEARVGARVEQAALGLDLVFHGTALSLPFERGPRGHVPRPRRQMRRTVY